MNFFSIDLRKFLLILGIVGFPLLITNLQRESTDEVPWYARPFTFVAGVVQNTFSSFSSGIRGTTAMYINLIDVKTKNRVLLDENAELRAQLGALTELKMENQRLVDLLSFKKETKMDLLAAKVVGRDLLADHQSVTINRGTRHGIKKNMAAITTGGVVGYVLRSEPFTSQILLLIDRYGIIDAIVQRSRARGIVEGRGPDSCKLRYLNRSDDVQVGDLVVTSGLDNIFPKGFPVGVVTGVSKSRYGMTQDIDLKPAINPSILEEMFIVINSMNEDFNPKSDEELVPNDEREKEKENDKEKEKAGSTKIEKKRAN